MWLPLHHSQPHYPAFLGCAPNPPGVTIMEPTCHGACLDITKQLEWNWLTPSRNYCFSSLAHGPSKEYARCIQLYSSHHPGHDGRSVRGWADEGDCCSATTLTVTQPSTYTLNCAHHDGLKLPCRPTNCNSEVCLGLQLCWQPWLGPAAMAAGISAGSIWLGAATGRKCTAGTQGHLWHPALPGICSRLVFHYKDRKQSLKLGICITNTWFLHISLTGKRILHFLPKK